MVSLSKGPWDGEGGARMGLGEAKVSSNLSLGCSVKHSVPKPRTLILPGTARLAGGEEQQMLSFPELLSTPGSVLLLTGSLVYPS